MHAPEFSRLLETIVGTSAAERSHHWMSMQDLSRPVRPHLTEAISYDTARLAVVDHQVKPSRHRNGNRSRFSVTKRVDRWRPDNIEEKVLFLALKKENRNPRPRAQRMLSC